MLTCMHLTRHADELKSEHAKVKAELEKLKRRWDACEYGDVATRNAILVEFEALSAKAKKDPENDGSWKQAIDPGLRTR